MIAQRPDKHGVVRLWYQRPPQAFIDMGGGAVMISGGMFLGRMLTHKGVTAANASMHAWLDKRDEWRPE